MAAEQAASPLQAEASGASWGELQQASPAQAAAAAGPGSPSRSAGPAASGAWSLPSGATSWLQADAEPDIERLEVSSTRKAPRPGPPQQGRRGGAEEAAPLLTLAEGEEEAAAGGWAARWAQPQPERGLVAPPGEWGSPRAKQTLFDLAALDLDLL